MLSHSVAISNCLWRSFFSSPFSKFEEFRNNAFINSAFVSGIFPIFILVKISIGFSSKLWYHITLVLNLNFERNSPLSKLSPLLSNQSDIVLYACDM